MTVHISNAFYTFHVPSGNSAGAAYFKFQVPNNVILQIESPVLKISTNNIRRLIYSTSKELKDDLTRAYYKLQESYQQEKNVLLKYVYDIFGLAITESIRKGGELYSINGANGRNPNITFLDSPAGFRRFESKSGELATDIKYRIKYTEKKLPSLYVTFGPLSSSGRFQKKHPGSGFTNEYTERLARSSVRIVIDTPESLYTDSTNVVGSIETGDKLIYREPTKKAFIGLGGAARVGGFRPFEGAITAGYDDIVLFAKNNIKRLAVEYKEKYEKLYEYYSALDKLNKEKAIKKETKKTEPDPVIIKAVQTISAFSNMLSTIAQYNKSIKKTKNKVRKEFEVSDGILSSGKGSSVILSDIQKDLADLQSRIAKEIDFSEVDKIVKGLKLETSITLIKDTTVASINKLSDKMKGSSFYNVLLDTEVVSAFNQYMRTASMQDMAYGLNSITGDGNTNTFSHKISTDVYNSLGLTSKRQAYDKFVIEFSKSFIKFIDGNISGGLSNYNKQQLVDVLKKSLPMSAIKNVLYQKGTAEVPKNIDEFSKILFNTINGNIEDSIPNPTGSLKNVAQFETHYKELLANYNLDYNTIELNNESIKQSGKLPTVLTDGSTLVPSSVAILKSISDNKSAFSGISLLLPKDIHNLLPNSLVSISKKVKGSQYKAPIVDDIIDISANVPTSKSGRDIKNRVDRYFKNVGIVKTSKGYEVTAQVSLNPTYVLNYALRKDLVKESSVTKSNQKFTNSILATANKDTKITKVFNNIFLDYLSSYDLIKFNKGNVEILIKDSFYKEKFSFIRDLYQKNFIGGNVGDTIVGKDILGKDDPRIQKTRAKFSDEYRERAAEFYGLSSALGGVKVKGFSVFDLKDTKDNANKFINAKSRNSIYKFSGFSKLIGFIRSLGFNTAKPLGNKFSSAQNEYRNKALNILKDSINNSSTFTTQYKEAYSRVKELHTYLQKYRNSYFNAYEITRSENDKISSIKYFPLRSSHGTTFKREFMQYLRTHQDVSTFILDHMVEQYGQDLKKKIPKFRNITNIVKKEDILDIFRINGLTNIDIISFSPVINYGRKAPFVATKGSNAGKTITPRGTRTPAFTVSIKLPLFGTLFKDAEKILNSSRFLSKVSEVDKSSVPSILSKKEAKELKTILQEDRLVNEAELSKLRGRFQRTSSFIKYFKDLSLNYAYPTLYGTKNTLVNRNIKGIEDDIFKVIFGDSGKSGLIDRYVKEKESVTKKEATQTIKNNYVKNQLLYKYEKSSYLLKEQIAKGSIPKNAQEALSFFNSISISISSLTDALSGIDNNKINKVRTSIEKSYTKINSTIKKLSSSIKSGSYIDKNGLKDFNQASYKVISSGIESIIKSFNSIENTLDSSIKNIGSNLKNVLTDFNKSNLKALSSTLISSENTLLIEFEKASSLLNSLENKSTKTINKKDRESLSRMYSDLFGTVPDYLEDSKSFFSNIRKDIEYFDKAITNIKSGNFIEVSLNNLKSLKSLEISPAALKNSSLKKEVDSKIKAINYQLTRYNKEVSQIEVALLKQAEFRIDELSSSTVSNLNTEKLSSIIDMKKSFDRILAPLINK